MSMSKFRVNLKNFIFFRFLEALEKAEFADIEDLQNRFISLKIENKKLMNRVSKYILTYNDFVTFRNNKSTRRWKRLEKEKRA